MPLTVSDVWSIVTDAIHDVPDMQISHLCGAIFVIVVISLAMSGKLRYYYYINILRYYINILRIYCKKLLLRTNEIILLMTDNQISGLNVSF